MSSFMPSFMKKSAPAPSAKPAAAAEPLPAEHDEAGIPKVIHELRDQIRKGVAGSLVDFRILGSALDFLKHPNNIDDRKMLLEYVLTGLATHPSSNAKAYFENETVKLLYNDLAHPPATYVGSPHCFREPDGSNNNLSDPNMGKSFTPYARSVQQSHPLPKNEMPDAGLVFDTLLKREEFVKHPAGLNSLMFSFAALVIHTVFRTSHTNPNINETSSYVDLSPLYGHNKTELDKIRVFDGNGLLKPDTFAEDRLLLLPPAVCTLLVLFSRNHNYIAKKLLEINERGTWQDPSKFNTSNAADKDKLLAQDEEIFQIARLVNCGWFGSAVFSDYFASILGLVRLGSSWSLNPFGEMRGLDHSLFERGRGNVCSVEFNCLYRWHATTSVEDEAWITQMMAQYFEKPADQITFQDFMTTMAKFKQQEGVDASHWTFGKLQRQENGSFKDGDLAHWLKNAAEHPASSFKARGTPGVMRLHEIMGIESNRKWGVCSLNDFRRYLGLKPYASFLEWNPRAEIAEAAERLYGDIENLELYVGLQAEEAKPVVDGAGLCPGYTISRAILSDAIALTRSDRFFTADYTPHNLTAWGFADCQRDPNGPGNGSMLGRLLLRTLPGEYTANSSYAWFPLQTPESMKEFLTKLKNVDEYTYARPPEPTKTFVVKDYRDAELVLNSAEFVHPYGDKAATVITGKGFFIADKDEEAAKRVQKDVITVVAPDDAARSSIGKYFYEKARSLLVSKSFTLSDKGTLNVDVIDVLKSVPLHWAMSEIAGVPIKDKNGNHGVYTESEIYDKLSDIYSYLFLDVDASTELRLEQRVKKHIADLKQHIKANVQYKNRLSIAGVVNTISTAFSSKPKKGKLSITDALFAHGETTDEAVNHILAFVVASTVELSQCLVNAVNVFFDNSDVTAPLRKPDVKAEALNAFIYESLRLDPPFRGVYRKAKSDQTIGGALVGKDQRVFVDLAAASLNDDVFPNSSSFSLNHTPSGKYLTGDGSTRVLGTELASEILGQILRAVFELDNVRRAPQGSGTLKRYPVAQENSLRYEYLGKDHLPSPWVHGKLILQYNTPQANGQSS